MVKRLVLWNQKQFQSFRFYLLHYVQAHEKQLYMLHLFLTLSLFFSSE